MNKTHTVWFRHEITALLMALFLLCLGIGLTLSQYWLISVPFIFILFYIGIQDVKFLFYLLLFSIPFSFEQQITAGFSTDLPDEPFMAILALLIGLTFLFSRKVRFNFFSKKNKIIHLLLLSLFWIGVTSLFSTYPIISIKYFLSKSWYVASFFVLPILIFNSPNSYIRAFQIMLFAMLFIILYSLYMQISNQFSFLQVNVTTLPFFRNHVTYSAFLVCLIPPLAITYNKVKIRKIKYSIGAIFCIALFSLIVSYSRGAWVALVACLPFYFILKRKKMKLFITGSLGIGFLVLLLFVQTKSYLHLKPSYHSTIYHADLKDHLRATYQLTDISFSERFHRWVAGARMFTDRPLTGFGPNSFYPNYKKYALPQFKTWVSENREKSSIHNYYLLLFSEQGLIGGILFITLLCISFLKIEKLYHHSDRIYERSLVLGVGFILTIICIELMVNDLIETDKIGSLFYLCLATLVSMESFFKKNDFTKEKWINN